FCSYRFSDVGKHPNASPRPSHEAPTAHKKAPHRGAFHFREIADHLIDNTQVASCLASSGVTGFAGIGTWPQTPTPPFWIFSASLATASFWPAYLAATSL